MTPEEYAASQYLITAGLAAYVQRVATFFTGPSLGPRGWLDFLRMMFPEVQKRYTQSSELGRAFYDSQRKQHHPDLVRNERLLTELPFEQFVQNMEPARKDMSQADSPRVAISKTALTAVREVEMAGRRQIIGAVKHDPEPVLQGWARVATGRETCAWCLMLISRGAYLNHKGNFAYREAATAGLSLDDETVLDIWKDSGTDINEFRDAVDEFMEEWHTGCDCMVVPVFDLENWPGRAAAHEAMKLWIDADTEATALIKSGDSRTNNKNRETINALRRRLYRGEVTMSTYALAA